MSAARRTLAAAAALALAAALPACDNAADRRIIRLQSDLAVAQTNNQQLNQQLADERARVEQLAGQLAELNRMPADRWELLPKASRIEIGRYSGLRAGKPELANSPTTQPADGGELPDLFVRVYLGGVDAKGRDIHPAGPVRIALFDLSGEQPRPLGVYRFAAAEAEAHYVSALGGQFYAFDLPLSAAPAGDSVTARVELTDLLTGRTLTAQEALKLKK